MNHLIYEGWYTDPYIRHEARWLSGGKATKLVRDGDVTSYDEPPSGPFLREPEPIEDQPPPGGNDLVRADDAERSTPDSSKGYMDQMDAVWSDGAPMPVLYKD